MFPLAGKTFPKTAQELTESIQSALSQVLTLKKRDSAVTVDAPQFPHVKLLEVNLDGATVTAKPPPPPKPTGDREKGIEVDQLKVSGHPIQYESSNVNLDFTARQVIFDFARDKNGNALLVLTDAAEGKVDVNVAKADLQSLAQSAASLAAQEHGVTIQQVDVDLQSAGTRAVQANVRVKARKAFVSGVVKVTSRLDLDDALNATISDLTCTGEGMVGNMVAALIQPKLSAYNGKKIALTAFSLGELVLKDLTIDVKDGLHVTASVGK